MLTRECMKQLVSVALITILLAVATGSARAETWKKDDWIYGSLSAAAGGAAGALAGGLAGSLLDGTCFRKENDCVPAFTIAGLWAGLVLGSAAGVTYYGKKRGLKGRMNSAVLGALLGNLASGSIVALAASSIDSGTIGIPIVLAAVIGGPAIGATIFYRRSLGSDSTADERTTAALLEISPERVKLRMPLVGLAVTRSETAVVLPLAGGRF